MKALLKQPKIINLFDFKQPLLKAKQWTLQHDANASGGAKSHGPPIKCIHAVCLFVAVFFLCRWKWIGFFGISATKLWKSRVNTQYTILNGSTFALGARQQIYELLPCFFSLLGIVHCCVFWSLYIYLIWTASHHIENVNTKRLVLCFLLTAFFRSLFSFFCRIKSDLLPNMKSRAREKMKRIFFRSSSPVPDAKASFGPKLYKKSIELYLLSKWVSS